MLRGRNTQRIALLAAIAAIGVGVVGLTAQRVLTDNDDPTPVPTFPVTSTAPAAGSPSGNPGAPTMSIREPGDGAVVAPGSLALRVDVGGFRLVDKLGEAVAAGEGHLLYYRDVDFVPTDPSRPASTAPGTFFATSELTHTWEAVDAGRHVFFVQLVNNDDTPLTPPVVDSVTVTVGDSAGASVSPSPAAVATPG